MNITEMDTKPSTTPWLVAAQVEKRNNENASRYTAKDRSTARTLIDVIEDAYSTKGVFLNFRKKFIAIKVNKPVVRHRSAVKILHEIFDSRGYSKAISAQGFVIRIPNTRLAKQEEAANGT